MPAERLVFGLHGVAVVLALVAALAWPRPGQAALLVPLGSGDLGSALRWADQEQAPLLAIDTIAGRAVIRVADNGSLLRALRAGLVPVAIATRGCSVGGTR